MKKGQQNATIDEAERVPTETQITCGTFYFDKKIDSLDFNH